MATKGPYEIRKNLELASGDILYREAGVYDTTLGLIDFGDTSLGGGTTEGYTENDQIRNVCYVDDYAYPNMAMLYDGGGIRVDEHNGSKITLPESFIIPATCTKQLVRMWFKLPTSDIGDTTVLYNNQLLVIGGTYASNQSLTYLGANNKADGTLNNMVVGGFGVGVDSGSAIANAVKTGQVVQLAWLATKIDDKFVSFRVFANGAYVADLTPVAFGSRPASIPVRQLNNKGASEKSVRNTTYRVAIDDLTDSALDPADIVAMDYSCNRTRFS
ncbi:TPA: hypothetical protein ACQ8L5_002285 [Klebsiella quasipneumoniae]|nr:hypothetical protein [Klebsiella quasipneumoniae subsp. similipneumoniae]